MYIYRKGRGSYIYSSARSAWPAYYFRRETRSTILPTFPPKKKLNRQLRLRFNNNAKTFLCITTKTKKNRKNRNKKKQEKKTHQKLTRTASRTSSV